MTQATKTPTAATAETPKSGVEIAATLRASATDRGKRVGGDWVNSHERSLDPHLDGTVLGHDAAPVIFRSSKAA
jgi:hypothetical protein